MTKGPDALAVFLRKLSKAAEVLTEEDIADVLAGKKRLVISAAPAGKPGRALRMRHGEPQST